MYLVKEDTSYHSQMKPPEERVSIQQFKDMETADEGNRKIIRDEIISRGLKLVYKTAHVIKKTQNIQMDFDDMVSIGTLGLIAAVDNFNWRSGFEFATFATKCIRWKIQGEWYRKEKKWQDRNISLDAALTADRTDKGITFSDILFVSDDDIYSAVYQRDAHCYNRDLVDTLLNSFEDERSKMIVSLFYGLNSQKKQSQRSVAKEFNLSQSYINYLLSKARSELKNIASMKGAILYDS